MPGEGDCGAERPRESEKTAFSPALCTLSDLEHHLQPQFLPGKTGKLDHSEAFEGIMNLKVLSKYRPVILSTHLCQFCEDIKKVSQHYSIQLPSLYTHQEGVLRWFPVYRFTSAYPAHAPTPQSEKPPAGTTPD